MCIFQNPLSFHESREPDHRRTGEENWEAGRKALEEHYRRAEVPATAELADKKGWYRSHLTISGEPMISVIIPSKDHINDLELCISSIEEKTTWKNYEIIIVENNSVEKETFVYYETLKNRYPNVRILTWKKEFNYSAINNFAVREARESICCFLTMMWRSLQRTGLKKCFSFVSKKTWEWSVRNCIIRMIPFSMQEW